MTGYFPDGLDANQKPYTVAKVLEIETRLQELIAQDTKIAKIFDTAERLEGLTRNAGIHAAGVIITEKPVVTYCPLYVGKDRDVVTQLDMGFAEKIGRQMELRDGRLFQYKDG